MKQLPFGPAKVAWGTLCAALAVAALSGCGSSGLPGLVPIGGTVAYDGKPLAEGEIRYIPAEASAGRMARGKIRDGRFSMSTARRDDGVTPGNYKIVIIAYGPEREPDRDAQGFVTKAHPRPLLVPEQYADPDSTPLSDAVDSSHSGSVEFELTD